MSAAGGILTPASWSPRNFGAVQRVGYDKSA
jgi:hypothetical protein